MNSKTKTLSIVLVPLVILGIIIAVYYLGKPQDIKSRKADFSIESKALNKEFLLNDSIASQKYSSKVIEVSGPVANIQKSKMHGLIITLDDPMMGMKCVMDSTIKVIPSEVAIGSAVNIKGVCIGFDPMIGLMMNQCILVK